MDSYSKEAFLLTVGAFTVSVVIMLIPILCTLAYTNQWSLSVRLVLSFGVICEFLGCMLVITRSKKDENEDKDYEK